MYQEILPAYDRCKSAITGKHALVAAGDIPISESALHRAISEKSKAAFVGAYIECFDEGMAVAGRQGVAA